MSFVARFPGTCVQCDDDIRRGEQVEYNDDHELQHVLCPFEATFENKPRPVCPHCFMALPLTGVCDCRE